MIISQLKATYKSRPSFWLSGRSINSSWEYENSRVRDLEGETEKWLGGKSTLVVDAEPKNWVRGR